MSHFWSSILNSSEFIEMLVEKNVFELIWCKNGFKQEYVQNVNVCPTFIMADWFMTHTSCSLLAAEWPPNNSSHWPSQQVFKDFRSES